MQKSNPAEKPVLEGGRIATYAKLRISRPDLSKRACRDIAGYAPTTSPDGLERTKKYRDIHEMTLQAAETVDVTPERVFKTLRRSMDRSALFPKGDCDATANSAAKTAGEFLGMAAPVQINTTVIQQQNTLVAILKSIQ